MRREKEREKRDADLTLSRKAMDLFQSGAGYAPFENAKVLLCVDI